MSDTTLTSITRAVWWMNCLLGGWMLTWGATDALGSGFINGLIVGFGLLPLFFKVLRWIHTD